MLGDGAFDAVKEGGVEPLSAVELGFFAFAHIGDVFGGGSALGLGERAEGGFEVDVRGRAFAVSFVGALAFAGCLGMVGCVGRVGCVRFGVVFGGSGFFEGKADALNAAFGVLLSAIFGAGAFAFLEGGFLGCATFGWRSARGFGFASGLRASAARGSAVALGRAAGDEDLGLVGGASGVLGSAFGGFFVAEAAVAREHLFGDAGVVFAEKACVFGRCAVGGGGDIDDLPTQTAGRSGLFFAILGASEGGQRCAGELFACAVEALELNHTRGGGWGQVWVEQQDRQQCGSHQVDHHRCTRKGEGAKILRLVRRVLGVLAWVHNGHE